MELECQECGEPLVIRAEFEAGVVEERADGLSVVHSIGQLRKATLICPDGHVPFKTVARLADMLRRE